MSVLTKRVSFKWNVLILYIISGSRSAQFYPSADETFNKVTYFVKLLDTIPTFPLTYGAVAFHTEHVTSILRWPYCDETLRETFR